MRADVAIAEAWQTWRALLRRPAYLTLAAATLALGVATTAAVFSLIDQALLRPLPFPQSQQLVTLGAAQGDGTNVASPLLFARLRELPQLRSAGLITGYRSTTNLSSGQAPVVAATVSADRGFLDTLGQPLAMGRNFSAEEDRKNGPAAVIVSHAFWVGHFGGDPGLLNRTLRLEGRPATVVGILPADFQWPIAFDLMLPMQLPSNPESAATNEFLVARMREGVDAGALSVQADASIKAALNERRAAIGENAYRNFADQRFDAQPLKHSFTSTSGATLLLFAGAAACVLLIVAINLTNLMALRAVARSHATAVRAAMGAPTSRLVLPALMEGALIGALGALIGVALVWVALTLMAALVPPEWLRGAQVRFTALSWLFAAVTALSVASLAALFGVWRGRGANLAQELVGGGRGGWSRAAGRLGRALVVAQIAIAVVLLTAAALFSRNLYSLATTPMGFDAAPVLTFSLSPVKTLYPDTAAVERQTRGFLERLARLPGVQAVGASTNLPTGSQLNMPVGLADGRQIGPQYRPVSAGFLDALRVPLRAGRGLDDRDRAGGEPVCLVSESFAQRYLSGNPLGQILHGPDRGERTVAMRIVGVVGDVRQYGPGEAPPPVVYVPLAQISDEVWTTLRDFAPLNYALRVAGAPQTYEPQLRAAMAEIDADQPIANVRGMDAVVAGTTDQQRLALLLVGVFAAIALLLASIGLYAVTSVVVGARQHEFGVRAALGAQPASLLRLVLKDAALQVGLGLLIGLIAALALSRLIQGFLYGVSAADPLAIAAVLAALASAGLLASIAPALRASRVHPMQVLRAP
ncbi:FtsX-like permease family protein [Lysobacter enzymogenes]|nr:ADOP family duplicated permease [Lysobacter enzymogenes]QCW27685.1 FtsX-like permease family protein [Lysobacter enzymogenes]